MSLLNQIFITMVIFLTGSGIIYLGKLNDRAIKLFVSFSGAFLFGVIVLHMLPEIYHSHNNEAGLFILCGFFLQVLLETFSGGIEHGHVHIHKSEGKHDHTKIVIASLFIHGFLEALPIGDPTLQGHIHNKLLIGILAHKIPITVVLTVLLLAQGKTKTYILVIIALFSLVLPAGIYFGEFLSGSGIMGIEMLSTCILAFVSGMLLHISTTILFETSENHRFNLLKGLVIILGVACAFIEF